MTAAKCGAKPGVASAEEPSGAARRRARNQTRMMNARSALTTTKRTTDVITGTVLLEARESGATRGSAAGAEGWFAVMGGCLDPVVELSFALRAASVSGARWGSRHRLE